MKATKQAMAANFVQISEDELDDWLNSLPGLRWKKKSGTAGIFLAPLSRNVAIKLSSTIGTRAEAMGRGKASMNLALVSLVTDNVLNKKAMGQARFHRTTNWRKTWAEGVKRMEEAYLKSKGFYEALAVIKDRRKYQDDTLALIESIPGWQTDRMLADFRKNVFQGGILTERQMVAVEAAAARAGKEPPAPKMVDMGPYLNAVDTTIDYFQWAAETWSGGAGDWAEKTLNFLQSVRDKNPDRLSPAQARWLNSAFSKVKGRNSVSYRLASGQESLTARIARRYMAG